MIYTTYERLSSLQGRHIEKLEGYTGPRNIYGMTTPIEFDPAIVSALGVEFMAIILRFAVQPPPYKTVALRWLESSSEIWDTFYPGDPRFENLIDASWRYMESTGEEQTEPRVDYCGNVLPGEGGDVLEQRLNQLISSFQILLASINPLDYDYPLFEFYSLGPLENLVGGKYVYVEEPPGSTDTFQATIESLPGYSTTSVTQLMENDELVKHTGFEYDDDYNLLRIVFRYDNSPELQYSPANLSKQHLVNAILITANTVLGRDNASLNAIAHFITESYRARGEFERESRLPLLSRIGAIGGFGYSPPWTGFDAWQPYMVEIHNAEMTKRAELLRDLSFVQTYGDTDLSGFLTPAERVNLEKEIQKRVVQARKEKAQEIQNVLIEEYDSWYNYLPTELETIFNAEMASI